MNKVIVIMRSNKLWMKPKNYSTKKTLILYWDKEFGAITPLLVGIWHQESYRLGTGTKSPAHHRAKCSAAPFLVSPSLTGMQFKVIQSGD